MKANILKTVAVGLMVLSLWSCKKDEDRIISDASPAGALSASATSVDLNIAAAEQTAVTFTFPAPTVTGYQVPVTSTLQFDLKGKNFATAKETVITTTTYSATVAELNKMLLSLGATIGVPAEMEVRLKSAPAPNAPTYSNVITISGTPYLASAWVYVPGAYHGWGFDTVDSLVSLTGNGVYEGVINMPADKLTFKITPKKAWDLAYGDGGGDALSTSGGDINAGTPGLKKITVDLNKSTYKIETADSWGLIGDATPGGWDKDTDLKLINDGKGMWTMTVALTAGEIKFRMNDAWDVNLGGADGKLTDGGDNIKVATAGNYTITLDPVEKTYTIVKN
ncbi:SusE domain-containing protein [Pedobacter sp. SAFR-022]|uniref:SusE domain-containing protein n=1 Tax=Pedobacter sp. SAFR-022 TaxID=3436861 RepID=UPI003F807FBA